MSRASGDICDLIARSAGRCWMILTPVMPPAPGGGGVYTHTLSEALVRSKRDVVVITERYPGRGSVSCIHETQGRRADVIRALPWRAGRARVDWRSYADYALQNWRLYSILSSSRLRAAVARRERCVVLVHASLIYRPNLLMPALVSLKAECGDRVRLVADVRDPAATLKHRTVLDQFDAVVASSWSVAAHLEALGVRAPIRHVPIPLAIPDEISKAHGAARAERYGLTPGRYVFSPNGTSRRKGHAALRDAVIQLRRTTAPDLQLVVAGRRRDWTGEDDRACAAGAMRFLGALPHTDVLQLAKAAYVTATPSPVEAPSRAALEALAVSGPVVLPPIPEFAEIAPERVAWSMDPEGLTAAIERASANTAPIAYDLSQHAPSKVVHRYLELEGDG